MWGLWESWSQSQRKDKWMRRGRKFRVFLAKLAKHTACFEDRRGWEYVLELQSGRFDEQMLADVKKKLKTNITT